MRLFKKIIPTLFIAIILGGCIHNDVPYPKIVARITEFEVAGQLSKPVMDYKNQIVTLELADTVDITRVEVLNFEVSDDAEINPEVTQFIDLSNDVYYILTTYQDYTWVIKAKQNIERYINADNQIGEATFNETEKLALVQVAKEQPLNDINITSMKLGPEGSDITPDYTSVGDFTQAVTFTSTYGNRSENWKVIFSTSTVNVITKESNAWARRVELSGSYIAGGPDPGFEYKRQSENNWKLVNDVKISGTNFTANISGLVPNTQYEYRAVSGSYTGETMTFTTESTAPVPNMNFDNWHKEGDIIYPSTDLTEANYWWDSGNKGANTAGKNLTTEERSFVVKGSAARLESSAAVGVMAAGNIFLGRYDKTFMVPPGAEIYFGRPYTNRPARMKGYYHYTPGIVDKYTSKPYFKGTVDSCHIYVILSDLDEPFYVNTKTEVFANAYKDNWIAYGEFKSNEKSAAGAYIPFTIELEYFSHTRKPKYLIIVATSSKYGDYFVGSTKSLLYLDEFEFEFD